jgi:hypothetical protein
MPNQKSKKTALGRLLNRKVRGLENMMWAVLAVVLVVVVGLAMWFIASGTMATVDAPQLQLVPHESFVVGTTANVTLKFGKGLREVSVSLMAPDAATNTMVRIATCTPPNVNVAEGEKKSFRCDNLQRTPGIIYVRVTWSGGSQTIKWVVG